MYESIFGQSTEEDDDDKLRIPEEEQNDPNEKDNKRRVGWMTIVYYLSRGNVTLMEPVLRTNLNQCLTLLSFEKSHPSLVSIFRRGSSRR